MAATEAPVSRRERVRAATIEEIKATALGLMREGGTTEVRFTDIARQMGMTAPALYRYFADRDELLTALITDAYDDLGADLARARATAQSGDLGARLLATAEAYRQWAHREPQQFALILGLPVPGYSAPDQGPTTEAASRAMSQMLALFFEARQAGQLAAPYLTDVDPAVTECGRAKHVGDGHAAEDMLPAASFQASMHAWAALHGFTSLEAYGHLDWMPPAARDALFHSHVVLVAALAGLPAPAH
jgi:AcrR family transcriptional regulator